MGLITYKPTQAWPAAEIFARVSPSGLISLNSALGRQIGLTYQKALLVYDTDALELQVRILDPDDVNPMALRLSRSDAASRYRVMIVAPRLCEQFGLTSVLQKSARYQAKYNEATRIISIDLTEPIGVRK